jgi:hypothetical protein
MHASVPRLLLGGALPKMMGIPFLWELITRCWWWVCFFHHLNQCQSVGPQNIPKPYFLLIASGDQVLAWLVQTFLLFYFTIRWLWDFHGLGDLRRLFTYGWLLALVLRNWLAGRLRLRLRFGLGLFFSEWKEFILFTLVNFRHVIKQIKQTKLF